MQKPDDLKDRTNRGLRPIPTLIFWSRWLQLPLYLGLIVAQCVYVVQFWQELVH
ncbi:MAG: putative rane protein, partial [Betaproteobacteria bacterium]|nr:putative rane protein [Betaproteobacteria bacterium]